MKRFIIFLFAFMILLPIISAETQIFSGTVITGNPKNIEGYIFTFAYDEVSNKVFVQNPSASLIIENGKCNSNNQFRVCINKANFSDRNVTTYVNYYAIDTTIYKLAGSLSSVSKISLNPLLPNEPATFTITISNPSDFDINSIMYAEDLSPFDIFLVEGCDVRGSTLAWKGSLNAKYDKKCSATITTEKGGIYNLAGNLSYLNPYETEKKNTDTLTVTVLPRQLKFWYDIDDNIEVKQPFYLNESINNIHQEEKIEVRLSLRVPNNARILKSHVLFNKEGNTLTRSFTLDPGTGFNYSLYLQADYESEAPITHTIDYEIKGIKSTVVNETFINALEPKPMLNFSTEYSELAPGQEFIALARISNPSSITELSDIKATLNFPFNDVIQQSLSKLLPKESYTIISNTLAMPKLDSGFDFKSNIPLELKIEYKFRDDIKYINKSLELKIKQGTLNIEAINETSIKDTKKITPNLETNVTSQIKTAPANETKSPVTIVESNKKSGIFERQSLVIGGSILAILIVITFIISKIKSKGKGNEPQEL